MKPQPVAVRPHLYRADLEESIEEPQVLAEDATLRGLVARLQALQLPDLQDVMVYAKIEGWQIDLPINRDAYSYRVDGHWMLSPLEAVPEHWDFPAPYMYFALDWKISLYLEAQTLTDLIRRLHEMGHTFVSSQDLKIGARFSRESAEADDVVQVPLSLLCHDCDPEDDDVFIVDEEWDEEWDEEKGEGIGISCSPLPLKAELWPADVIMPHFLFGDMTRQQQRLKTLI